MGSQVKQALEQALVKAIEEVGLAVEAAGLERAVAALLGDVVLLGDVPPEGGAEGAADTGYDPVKDGEARAKAQRGARGDPDSLAWR